MRLLPFSSFSSVSRLRSLPPCHPPSSLPLLLMSRLCVRCTKIRDGDQLSQVEMECLRACACILILPLHVTCMTGIFYKDIFKRPCSIIQRSRGGGGEAASWHPPSWADIQVWINVWWKATLTSLLLLPHPPPFFCQRGNGGKATMLQIANFAPLNRAAGGGCWGRFRMIPAKGWLPWYQCRFMLSNVS